MPGRGPAPRSQSRTDKVVHGWRHAEGVGWRHGPVPPPPKKLLKVSRDAWELWFGAWYAWFWEPEDVPALEVVIECFDAVRRGERQRLPELRLQLDAWGISKRGQQDRRWRPPETQPADGKASGEVVSLTQRFKVTM